MTNKEEVEVQLGFNLSTLKAGAQKAMALVEEFASKARHTINHIGQEILAPLSAAGLAAGFEKAMDRAEQISRIAEASGLDPETWQKLAYTVKGVGGSAEDAEKWIGKLSAVIGEARNGSEESAEKFSKWGIKIADANGAAKETKQIIEDISTRMEEMTDPTQKAAMAFDIFRKGTAKAVAALSEWKKNHGEGAAIFSNKDIEQLKEAHHSMEATQNDFIIGLGKMVLWAGQFYQIMGKLSNLDFSFTGVGKDADRDRDIDTLRQLAEMRKQTKDRMAESDAREAAKAAAIIEKQKEEHQAVADLEAKTAEIRQAAMQKELSLKDQEAAIVEKILAIKKEQIGLDEESFAYAAKENEVAKLEKEAEEVHKKSTEERLKLEKEIKETRAKLVIDKEKERRDELAPFAPSVEEVKNSGHWERNQWGGGKRWVESPFAQMARNEDRLKNKIHNDILMGRGANPDDIKNFQGIQKQLADAGIGGDNVKLDAIKSASEQTAENLNELIAKGKAININPAMK